MQDWQSMKSLANLLFTANAVILVALLIGAVWSVAFPENRIWPPPRKHSWQHILTWACFYIVFIFNAALFVLDWNSWFLQSKIRLVLGIPLALIGGLLVSWGVATLGVRNSSGLREGFVTSGPYRFTRNPQYLGDMILFIGLSVIVNSLYLWMVKS